MSSAEPLPSAFSFLLPTSTSMPSSSPWDAALWRAWREAHKGVGRTWPNPAVGCVLVDAQGDIVAVGHHAMAGRPHAEVNALEALLAERGPGAARGLTAVVTLEPCAHHGRTPPCADRLLREGIARVVVGARDPNPRVDGRGLDTLRAGGVEVIVASGPVATACASLIAPFSTTIARDRCYVVLKTATSLDGRVATRTGASRFITGAASRRLVHRLRDAVDAVVVGASTVVADDPALTVRDVVRDDGIPVRDPLRVVLDRRATLPLTARVFDPPGALLVHDVGVTPKPMAGVDHVPVAGLEIPAVMAALHGRGLTSVMVEAGPRLAAAVLAAGVIDELWCFTAPVVIGGDGVPAIGSLGVNALVDAPRLHPIHRAVLDDDSLVVLRPATARP
jgi:diaminohydroxyphosphoribosylaminopyrimidine deaminase/5-amino-6-(5-phosphoribosylamino)uracil reductase